MNLKDILSSIEKSREGIIADMAKLISIPAIGPYNGGEGEVKKADALMKCLEGFDSVERYDVEDDQFPGVIRPNVVAIKKGKKKGTVWIVSHLDTVLPGNISEWNTEPYAATVVGDKIYGLGTEDNGQAILSSIYSTKFIDAGTLKGMSIGLAFVADEETKSAMGVGHLIKQGLFTKDDFILVPDWGSPNGRFIDVAEKHLIWFKIEVHGKQTHGAVPNKGINAYRVGINFLSDLLKRFEEKFTKENPLYRPACSTFEPTRASETVGNVNTIPGYYEFYIDCRLIPDYTIEEITDFVFDVAKEHSEKSSAKIVVSIEQSTQSGPQSSIDSKHYIEFKNSIEEVLGIDVTAVGVGGGTCANFFREIELNAYVWECGGGTLHQPNEYVEISNIINDAKVFATLFYNLCVNSLE